MKNIESWILSYLLNSLWQIPLLFAAGWIAARSLRRIAPVAEHRVWVSVLLLQSIVPALSTLPLDRLRTLLVWSNNSHPSNDALVSVVMGPGTTWSSLHLSPAILTAITIAYFVVITYFAGRFAWQWLQLNTIRLESVEADLTEEAANYWERYSRRFGVKAASVAASSRIFSPVTMGLSQKLVLLPATMVANIPDIDIATVLAHEFAHMHRNDYVKNLVYELLSLPMSYHPLLWLTREKIMETREIVCDRLAAEVSGRKEYARSLLRLASLLLEGVQARTAHTIGIFDTNTLERRLMRLTEKQPEIRGLRRLAIITTCVALGIGTFGSALALRMHIDADTASNHDSSQPSGPIAVSPEVMAGNRVNGTMPKYPEEAKKAKIQGTVVLKAKISKTGTVEALAVVSGPVLLQQSALDAVKEWTYKPFLLNGNPTEVKTLINVIYSLGKK